MSLSTDTSDHAQRIAELESALAEMTAERDGWKRNCKVTLEDRILRLEDRILGLKRHNAELKAALAKPASSPAGGDVDEALNWALDEIDTLSNKLCQFAYPQGMAMLGRPEQLPQYEVAVRARAALSQSTSAGRAE